MIAVCIPTRGIVFTEVMQAVVDNCVGRDWRLFTSTDEGLPDSVNGCVERALASGAEWVWIVEEDTVPPRGVLDEMLAERADYVACDYDVWHGHTCACFDLSTDPPALSSTGLGCTLIEASVFARVPRPWFTCDKNMQPVERGGLTYFTAIPGTVGHRGGHDLSFGERLRAAGIEMKLLRDRECRHLRVANWNAASDNHACHTITALPPIAIPWQEYTERPTVSVVIPCHNYANYLPDAIESALAQSIPCEVVVVDDGSTDGSSDVARSYHGVKVVRQDNRGLPAARNAGVAASNGSHFIPLDADDTLLPGAVEAMLNAGRVAVRCTWVRGNKTHQLPTGTTLAAFLTRHGRAAATGLFARRVWNALGGYDEEMRDGFEDWDWWVRLAHAGFPIVTLDTPAFDYRYHGPSLAAHAIARTTEITKYLHAKWDALGIRPLTAPRPAVPLHYPVRIAVPVTIDGTTYPAGSRIDRETALAAKASGQLKDARIA